MRKTMRFLFFFLLTLLLSTPFTTETSARFGGGSTGSRSGGGGQGTAPDYGDLIVIARDRDGVPILDANGCLQPLNSNGDLIPLDAECEVLDETAVIEVEFGRLNVARAPEKVKEQALDEVIQAIKDCLRVTLDPAGRLALKYKIVNPDTGAKEVVWKTIDAARENLALYSQLMKFGHLQTACGEISSDRGDETTYRPCLDPTIDYPKFRAKVKFLLPVTPGATTAESLSNADLTLASSFLAGAADKSGTITVDLVQYLNTILGVPNTTNSLTGAPEFVNYSAFVYKRSKKFDGMIPVLQPTSTDGLWRETEVNILDWLTWEDENDRNRWRNIKGFVQAANDSLRTILFMHNYEIPVPLWTYTIPGLSGAIPSPE
jgi:hypothetical protein